MQRGRCVQTSKLCEGGSGQRMAFDIGQALQGDQCGQDGEQSQQNRHWPLVQQQGGEGSEQGKSDQAAGITQAAGFGRFDGNHRGQQGAAGIASKMEAHLRKDAGQDQQRQQQA